MLNSMCNLKSSKFEVLISSGPCPGLISAPSWTFHSAVDSLLAAFHPVRSLPLNNRLGFPHLGVPDLLSAGARTPVHDQVVPSGPLTVPLMLLPESFPSKTMSALAPSSSLGEVKVSLPSAISTLGSGRAFPQRPTICALT